MQSKTILSPFLQIDLPQVDIMQAMSEVEELIRLYGEIRPDKDYFLSRNKGIQISPNRFASNKSGPRTKFHEMNALFEYEKELCLVSANHCNELASRSKEYDVLEHLGDFLPREGRKVGLVTFQNGIMNTPDDFKLMGEQILRHFPENPLCIGLYNRKLDLFNHLKRVRHHMFEDLTKVVGRTYVFFKKLIKLVHSVNEKILWVHVMHSEGGAIGNRALQVMSEKEKELFKRHLVTVSCGPLLPIPRDYVLQAYNTYSSQDYTTGFFGAYFRLKKEYDISFEQVKAPFWRKALQLTGGLGGNLLGSIPPGDHDFRGVTYKKVLIDNVKDINDKIKGKVWGS